MKQLRKFIRKVLLEKIHKEDFEDVMQTAQLAHMGQMRRDGTPYITHPMEVMEITKRHYPENYAAQLLALLHDVIEDGPSAELPPETEALSGAFGIDGSRSRAQRPWQPGRVHRARGTRYRSSTSLLATEL